MTRECRACRGSGYEVVYRHKAPEKVKCPVCDGRGRLFLDTDTLLGLRAAVREYAYDLLRTDYRGNRPPEHGIGYRLLEILGEGK